MNKKKVDIRSALAGGGAVLAVVAAIAGFSAGVPTGDVIDPVEGEPTSIVVVAPASAGLSRAEEICSLGFAAKRVDGGYVIIFGQDVLEWVDSPPGQPLGLLNGQPFTLSPEVQKCIRNRF